MLRVLSRETTDLAYDGVHYEDGQPVHPRRPGKVIIRPGYNTVSAEGEALLRNDENFRRHVDDGFMTINPAGDVEAAEAAEAFEPVEEVEADPRAQREGESNTAFKKRIKALDDAAAAETAAADKPRADFLAQFNGTDKAAQDAVYPTLTDEQKGWVDGDRVNKTGA